VKALLRARDVQVLEVAEVVGHVDAFLRYRQDTDRVRAEDALMRLRYAASDAGYTELEHDVLDVLDAIKREEWGWVEHYKRRIEASR
jgi:hypothetical protein